MSRLSESERTALLEERDFLLASIEDLDNERIHGDIDEADHDALRSSYVARVAAIARELNADAVRARPRARGRLLKAAIAVVVVLSLGAGSGVWLATQSGQRLPGQSITGGIEDSTASMLAQARLADVGNPAEALQLYNAVLALEPDSVEALTYRGWLLTRIIPDAADLTVDEKREILLQAYADMVRARAIDEDYPDVHCLLGVVEFRVLSRASAARESLDACLALSPPHEVVSLVAGISSEIDSALAGG
jgi:hypothetical protein